MFPAPNEEDRELYGSFDADFYIEVERFPSPLEVDRFLYWMSVNMFLLKKMIVSVPSRGGLVLIRKERRKNYDYHRVSVPSRGGLVLIPCRKNRNTCS